MAKMNPGFATLFAVAETAGQKAAAALTPVPTTVGTAVGLSDQIDYTKPTYFVPDGVCGFAWVTVRPGNCPFANWLKKTGKARKAYHGGVEIWVSAYNQSMQKKEAHAAAMAKVLNDAGLNAYSGSRMD